MKTFTLTGALTAVALCLAVPGAAWAQQSDQQKAMPPAASDQQPAATEEESKAEDEAAATEEEGEAKDEAATEEEGKAEEKAATEEKTDADTAASAEGTAVVGQKLYGAGDESFGEIDNVLFADGKAHAVIVNIGGFLGIGSKTVAIPMDQISVEGDRVVAMGLTREDAEALPEWKEPREEPPAPTGTPGAQPGAQPAIPGQPAMPGQPGKTQ